MAECRRAYSLTRRRRIHLEGRVFGLPMLRAFVHGRLSALEGVEVLDWVEELREHVCEQLAPGVHAQWTDPLERIARG